MNPKNSNMVEQIPQNGYDTRLRRRMLALSKENKKTVKNTEQATTTQHQYNLRSKQPLYDVNIDFDEASAAWNRNKRRVGQCYVYIS